MLTVKDSVSACAYLSFLPHSSQFGCLLAIPFLLTTVVMHWKGEPKSHYISLVVAVAAESHYSSLTVSKRAAVLGCAQPPALSHHAPLAGNCLILQQAGGETAATPMHVSLSWVGVGFGVTHKCCLGSTAQGRKGQAVAQKLNSGTLWRLCRLDQTEGSTAMEPQMLSCGVQCLIFA